MGQSCCVHRDSVPRLSGTVVAKQAAVIVVGIVLAGVMIMLGWWQLQVYRESGDQAAQERINQPALELAEVAPAGADAGESFGRTVRLTGTYDSSRQVLVPDAVDDDVYRVVTAFVQDSGDAVAVVRGTYRGDPAAVPEPPSGHLTQQGVLMPNEGTDDRPVGPGQLSSVRISVLAQEWPWPLVSGFVTLDEADTTPGLEYRAPAMPREGGALRNGAYAVQWWVFAAFAVGLGLKMAHDFGREARLQTAEPTAATEPTTEADPAVEPQTGEDAGTDPAQKVRQP